jgi:1-acyl-sn-glycerol-3-phosphate acyltransferase
MIPPIVLRRLLVDPLFTVAALAAAVVFAVLAGLSLASWPVDRRLRASRLAALAAAYLLAEAVALIACFGLWLLWPFLRRRWRESNLTVLRRALRVLFALVGPLTGFRLDVIEPPPPTGLDGDAPVLVISRHAGAGDSFTLIHLLLDTYERRPVVVLTARLQLDPAIDVLIHRIGGCFLYNDGGDPQAAGRVGRCARQLGGGDALVIFPEGGNFSISRRLRAIHALYRRGRLRQAMVAEELTHVLPPRPAGVFAVLDARTVAGALIVAHTGLDELAGFGDIWRALPLSRPLRMRWWYVPVEEIPVPVPERLDWLMLHWAIVDQWIDAQRPAVPTGG